MSVHNPSLVDRIKSFRPSVIGQSVALILAASSLLYLPGCGPSVEGQMDVPVSDLPANTNPTEQSLLDVIVEYKCPDTTTTNCPAEQVIYADFSKTRSKAYEAKSDSALALLECEFKTSTGLSTWVECPKGKCGQTDFMVGSAYQGQTITGTATCSLQDGTKSNSVSFPLNIQ